MTRQQLRALDMVALKSTYPDGDPYDLTIAGDFCIISTGETIHLAFAANKLAAEGGGNCTGHPRTTETGFISGWSRRKSRGDAYHKSCASFPSASHTTVFGTAPSAVSFQNALSLPASWYSSRRLIFWPL